MLVILNSDILYSQSLLTSLTSEVQRLIDVCSGPDHVIAVPETTKLEFDRKQSECVSSAQKELTTAYETLTRFGISYEKQDVEKVIRAPDLLGLITNSGATVKLIEPIIEDFREAHRRACLHLAPHAVGDTKSDEMRDLVIWMIAVRLANENGGALLVSRDKVHTNNRGNPEADRAGLERMENVDDALEFLNVQTPAGQAFRRLMEPAWPLLAEEGLPIGTNPAVRSVSHPVFEQGIEGLQSASCILKVSTNTRKILRARVEVEIFTDHQEVTLRNIFLEGGHYPSTVGVRIDMVPERTAKAEERLAELRRILESEL